MIHKKLTEITLADIRQLIDLSVLESMTIEYKEKLNINTDNDKKELLKDLSAFANEDGGDLIIGIKEDKGIPTEIIGVRINDIDAAIGSLTNLILDGIEPRINFEIHYIQYNEQNYVLIFRITKNYNAPHRVILKNHGHFYGKTSSIVRAYNTAQLRDKFNNEPLLNDKINQFTKDRLIKIKDGKIPIHFARFGKACLHIVPSDAFTIGNPLDIQKIFDNTFIPNINGFIPQYNDNGVMLFKKNQEGVCISYCQIFRNSILEIVYSLHQHQHANDKQIPYKYEHKLTALLHEKLTFLKKIGVKPHIFISFT